MKVIIGEEGLGISWQGRFDPDISCPYCHGRADFAFVAYEGLRDADKGSFLCSLKKNEGKNGFWVHDCCAVAVYFCRGCLKAVAEMNQG